MIKLTIAIVVLLGAGIVWLRAQWARSRNSHAAKEIIDNLKSGKYGIESYAESLNIMICSKPISPVFDPAATRERLRALTGKQLEGKFSIQFADMNDQGKGIVIGEAKSKDIVAGYGGNKEIDIHFPCWVYIDADRENNSMNFRSTFPESKDHHYLLEDLSGIIYKTQAPAEQ